MTVIIFSNNTVKVPLLFQGYKKIITKKVYQIT